MPGYADFFIADHLELDRLVGAGLAAARSGDWAAYRERFSTLRAALVEHMRYEEEALFPELERRLGAARLEPLQRQHDRLRRHFETLGSAAPEHDPEGCLAELEELAALLQEHHAAERQVLPSYPSLNFDPGST